MPNRKQHLTASKKYLGYSNPIVHQMLDAGAITEHRRSHNTKFISLIGEMFGKEYETEAWLHIFLDYGVIDL